MIGNQEEQSRGEQGFYFCFRMEERRRKLEKGRWLRRKKTRTWGTSWTDEFSASDTQRSDCAVLIGVGRSFQLRGDENWWVNLWRKVKFYSSGFSQTCTGLWTIQDILRDVLFFFLCELWVSSFRNSNGNGLSTRER